MPLNPVLPTALPTAELPRVCTMATQTAPPEQKPQTNPPGAMDAKALLAMGLERTNNKTGFMFHRIDESASYWLNSLPHSPNPLVDLGSAYGVHTLHALKAGRDVIAVDMDEVHIAGLQERVDEYLASPAAQTRPGPGRLVRATVAKLPQSGVCDDESVAGVLLSEMLHFLKPGEPLPLLKDIYRWLEPGGCLVATVSASVPANVATFSGKAGYVLRDGRTAVEADKLISSASGQELMEMAPAFMELPASAPFRIAACGHLYLMSAKELKAFAKQAGFQIERCSDITQNKYPGKEGNAVLLVARKPDTRKQKQKVWAAAAVAAGASALFIQYGRKR